MSASSATPGRPARKRRWADTGAQPPPAADAEPTAAALIRLVQALQAFYRTHARDLPWRRSRDPYQIWISEIMCQQTRIDTVVPRYHAFLRAFPTVSALAAATPHDVCAAWAGLGYYRRARHLHRAAQQVVNERAGAMPQTAAELRKLAGIGAYTAGAIASIAYGEVTPLVDGNVARVLARLFGLLDFVDEPAGSALVWGLAGRLVTAAAAFGTPGDFNQALMELGATLCSPLRPACHRCPVQFACAAHAEGMQHSLPRKRGKAVATAMQVAFAYVTDGTGTYLHRRDLDGLWAGLWELPSAHGADAAAQLEARGYVLTKKLAVLAHLLTHRRITATVYLARRLATAPVPPQLQACAEPLQAALSTLARKAIVAARNAMVGSET